MDAESIQRALEDTFDQAIVYHAFTDYMRDYEVIVHAVTHPLTGIRPAYLRYLFKYCAETHVISAVTAEAWRKSLDDRLIDYESGRDLDGYVWGVKRQNVYPGVHVQADSTAARRWRDAIGIPFHEVRFDTNGHDLTLVFHDLEVSEVGPGYAPFVVPEPRENSM